MTLMEIEQPATFAEEHIAVTWTDLGESLSGGDWDEADPDDVAVLRFDVCVRADVAAAHGVDGAPAEATWANLTGYVWPQDTSYATRVPADTDPATLHRLAERVAEAAVDGLSRGQLTRALEAASWVEPGWA